MKHEGRQARPQAGKHSCIRQSDGGKNLSTYQQVCYHWELRILHFFPQQLAQKWENDIQVLILSIRNFTIREDNISEAVQTPMLTVSDKAAFRERDLP